MSAERDQSQKFKFVYSNLYQIYQKGKAAAHSAPSIPTSGSAAVSVSAVKVSAAHVGAARVSLRRVSLGNAPDLNSTTGLVSGAVIKAGAKVKPLARPYEGRDFASEKRINLQRIHEMRESVPQKEALSSLRANLSDLEN